MFQSFIFQTDTRKYPTIRKIQTARYHAFGKGVCIKLPVSTLLRHIFLKLFEGNLLARYLSAIRHLLITERIYDGGVTWGIGARVVPTAQRRRTRFHLGVASSWSRLLYALLILCEPSTSLLHLSCTVWTSRWWHKRVCHKLLDS